MRGIGAWCNGSTPAFGAVDLGSTPSAPVLVKHMKSDSSHSHSEQDKPDPYKPGSFREGLCGHFAMQAVCGLMPFSGTNPQGEHIQ